MNPITQEEVYRALQWLVDNAQRASEARATRLYLEDYSKVIKSTLMSEHLEDGVTAQERFALSDERYKIHLDGLRVAIAEDEKFRWLKDAANAKVEAFRTFEASTRQVR